jgi:hypothetical protein
MDFKKKIKTQTNGGNVTVKMKTEKMRALGSNPMKGKVDLKTISREFVSFRLQKVPIHKGYSIYTVRKCLKTS